MAKFKPVRSKKKTAPVQGGLPCVILLLSGFVLVLVLLFLILKYAS
jgi:hypothetical protein